MDREKMLKVAKIAAVEAGKIISSYFFKKKEISFDEKQDKTYVSKCDLEAERKIRDLIETFFPGHSINGEEFGFEEKHFEKNIIWHVDPLDGTSNFKNRIGICAVSIGIEIYGKFEIGVIYDPFMKKLYYGICGAGAFVEDEFGKVEKLSVNSMGLEKGILVFDGSFRKEMASCKLAVMKNLSLFSRRYRVIGSNVLQFALVSSGAFIGSLSDHVYTYDFAAGVVLVREAGGIVTDGLGREVKADSKVIVVGNSVEVHAKILDEVKKVYWFLD